MKKNVLPLLFLLSFFISCGQSEKNAPQSKNKIIPFPTEKESGFYAVAKNSDIDFNSVDYLKNLELDDSPTITIDDISSAKRTKDIFGKPNISLKLTANGAKKFEKLTQENIGFFVAIVMDKKIISAPRINSVIPNGYIEISGDFTKSEVDEIIKHIYSKK